MFYVKIYKENVTKDPAKAAAALFVLALCEKTQLEEHK